ncbi:hypothetical protein ACSBR1_019001 [Camellia fascicularis]
MATLKVQEDSSISHCTYHVFLSFRGKDTRKTFTDHLYTALVQAGFRTFKDDEDIESGEIIPVFYDVDPTEVKNQTGSFAEAFMRHEQMEAENDERKNEWMEKVKKWRAALRKVVDLGGRVFQNQTDG